MSGVTTVAAVYQPMVLLGAAGGVLVLIVGVVLPAVWSRKKERRAAAARVLRELLTTIRPAIPKPADSPQRPASTTGGQRVDRDDHRMGNVSMGQIDAVAPRRVTDVPSRAGRAWTI